MFSPDASSLWRKSSRSSLTAWRSTSCLLFILWIPRRIHDGRQKDMTVVHLSLSVLTSFTGRETCLLYGGRVLSVHCGLLCWVDVTRHLCDFWLCWPGVCWGPALSLDLALLLFFSFVFVLFSLVTRGRRLFVLGTKLSQLISQELLIFYIPLLKVFGSRPRIHWLQQEVLTHGL